MKFERRVLRHHGEASHPSRGAWIEIIRQMPTQTGMNVAPLTGCVD